ncbi:hypothetical protein JCM19376_26490 [Fusibacter bizertensis]
MRPRSCKVYFRQLICYPFFDLYISSIATKWTTYIGEAGASSFFLLAGEVIWTVLLMKVYRIRKKVDGIKKSDIIKVNV